MSTAFSWTDRLNACLPCLRTAPSADDLTNAGVARDDLRGLLADAETLSLHSNPGSVRRKSRARIPRSISLFGFYLFGRPAIQLPADNDDSFYGTTRPTATGPITPTLTVHSTATFDSDAAPLDADTINSLSSTTAAALAEAEEEERRQKEERRRRRRERREMKKMAQALSVTSGDSQFEGFQGSGDGYPGIPSPFWPEHEQQQPLLPEEDDEGADLDGGVYTRRRTPAGTSNAGSDSRSRTSTSLSDRLTQHPTTSTPSKKSKSKSASSGTSHRRSKSKSTHSSNSYTNTNTDSTSLASPASHLFSDDPNASVTTVTVISPSTIEQGQGFFDLEDDIESEVRFGAPVVPKFITKSAPESESERGGFPSTGFGGGRGFGFSGGLKTRGAFLANTEATPSTERHMDEDAGDY
ncbi:hypothetical protein P691DRAFT_777130 [Macrolepiota fuliginosa MF-IS2]|uniref:Uncharacterized protein n=1 Tax=Macrolepiota fuliginosa MF-IS2 TaxID=1400762 RepID=A0A9P5XB36_9AGAR|nr:hypothetical protein P691DRAFT_777130 [Macrolepiota fuliginosa MF-IS2]